LFAIGHDPFGGIIGICSTADAVNYTRTHLHSAKTTVTPTQQQQQQQQ